jgi:DNA modification methylase
MGTHRSSDLRRHQRDQTTGTLRIPAPATDRGAAERVNGSAEPIAAQHRLKIVYRKIDAIRPNPRNPRKHSRRQIKKLARIIKNQGCVVPLLDDRYGNLLAGHARYEACRLLGLTEIPTICLEHLDERQAQAFMLADNRLAELSEWDDKLLAEHLKELSLALDFEIELSGFELGEIDLRIESLNSASEKAADAADALPQMPMSKLPVTRTGDLWLLGEHRILCDNALEESSYVALMNGKFAAMVLSDPPFNVRIAGNVSGLGRIQHRDFVMAAGEMSEAEFTLFLSRVCALFARHSKDGSLHYLFIDWRHVGEMVAAGKVAYTELKNIAVWVKNAPGMGSFYRSQHELIAIFKSGRGPHRNNVQLGEYGRNRSNVWPYPSINSFGRAGEEGNLLASHPTVKPVALLADAIMDCTARGDIIVDGFLGSGSTVIAAERTGRRCYGIEIDPLYADVAVRRWQNYSRDRARHAATGRFFDEMEVRNERQAGE